MLEFECAKCGNWKSFLQVSQYNKGSRTIELPRYEKPIVGEWQISNEEINQIPGFYCLKCGNFISEPFKKEEVRAEFQYLVETSLVEISWVDSLHDRIAKKLKVSNQRIVPIIFREPKEAKIGRLDIDLNIEIILALKRMGLYEKLYEHQVAAIGHILQGENVVIQTGTATGKSLTYQVPILNSIRQSHESTALYVAPLKALARDQMRMLSEFDQTRKEYDYSAFWEITLGLTKIAFGLYEGGMKRKELNWVSEKANIILTTPEMLNFQILKAHRFFNWKLFFKNIRYLIFDEIHAYHGIFGSHMANVIRRLRRICEFYDANPVIICCSATIKNPKELAERLVGVPFTLIENDTAKKYKQKMVLWNSPFDKRNQSRGVPQTEALNIAEYILKYEKKEEKYIKNLIFCKSRREAGLLSYYLKDRFENNRLFSMITSYKSEFTAEKKLEIIRKIKSGAFNVIFSTNALELGIDIGDLDAGIVLGFPNSFASLHQQCGRIGRTGESIIFFVALNNPLDQYFIDHPQEFLKNTPESVIINPNNRVISKLHILEAMEEIPIVIERDKQYFSNIQEMIELINLKPPIQLSGPPQNVQEKLTNLRSFSSGSVKILCREKIIGEMDRSSAMRDLFEGAIWLGPDEEKFKVKELNVEENIAIVEKGESPFYTQALINADVSIKREIIAKEMGELKISYGEIKLTKIIRKYIKKLFGRKGEKRIHPEDSILEISELKNPCTEIMDVYGFWFPIPDKIIDEIRAHYINFSPDPRQIDEKIKGGLHALEHALCSFIPIYAICSENDLGGFSSPSFKELDNKPAIFIYEGYPGELELAREGYEHFLDLLGKSKDRIEHCECDQTSGCPSCIQDPLCGNSNIPLDKMMAKSLLDLLLKFIQGVRLF